MFTKMHHIGNRWFKKTTLTIALLNLPFIFCMSSYLFPSLQDRIEVGAVRAQDVTVTVTPIQSVLPPQAMLYISNPGNYFNVSITNNTMTSQNVYLGLRVEHTMPNDGLSIATPPKRMPAQPISVAPGATRHLLPAEIRTLFNHIPSNEIMASPGLFENYNNGSLGLLPEGQYQGTMTAYLWDPALSKPVAVSNPITGTCYFTICYKAQAPEFLTPMVVGLGNDLIVANLDKQNPQFTWRAPIINCNPTAVNFRYSLKIVELKERQTPDQAMQMNASVLTANELSVPLYMVPANYFGPNRIEEGKTYVAQVTAKAVGFGANNLNYTTIENEGKSNYRLFRLGNPIEIANNVNGNQEENQGNPKDDKGKNDDEDDEDIGFGDSSSTQGKRAEYDSLYVFTKPKLNYPTFDEGTARKLFLKDDMVFEWKKSRYQEGHGSRQDTVKVEYEMQLFRGKPGTTKEDILKGKPVFTKNMKDGTYCKIEWDELESAELLINDHMVACVMPKSSNTKSLRFADGEENIIDFAMADHLSKKYFMCTGMVDTPDATPTKAKAADLKGKTVAIGQYQLTIDEIEKVSGKDYFTGKGHVEWNPLGFKCMVCVQFDTLFINTDNIVYGGRAKTYPKPSDKGISDSEVVDKLFSEWGIDNLIGDTRIPYAKEIQDELTSQAKGLAEQIDISKYYTWVKKGEAVVDQFLRGTVDNLYFPLSLPKEINTTPVDIQISSMKFMPTYATMDVFGQFILPDSKITKNQVLLLGAPRLCISPDRVLPESGQIALLGNVTLQSPDSSFTATFRAPQNLLEPEDGCYISWKGDKLEIFGIDVDMTFPRLYKDRAGKRTEEMAVFNAKASIGAPNEEGDWDDWFASIKMDPFQVKSLDGWTFKGGTISYDHSKYRVVDDMQKLPDGYNMKDAGLAENANVIEWMGLYVRGMSIVMPKGLKFNGIRGDKKGMQEEDDGRLSITCETMLVDKSGVTASVEINNLIDVSTGKLGGWGFSMDKFYLNIFQTQFKNCGFIGQIDVPLLDGNIQYFCDIANQGVGAQGGEKGDWSYTFKTQQVNDLKLDFFIGEATFYKEQTFFELSIQDKANGTTDTRVELCAGGDISIIGSDKVDGVLKKYTEKFKKYLPFEISMPRIHFSKLRVANFDVAESKIMKNIEDTSTGQILSFNDLFNFKSQYEFTGTSKDENGKVNKCFFGPGEWSLTMGSNQAGAHAYLPAGYGRNHDANLLAVAEHGPTPYMDAVDAVQGDVVKGNFGPFSLALKEYSFKQEGSRMGLYLKGGLTILDNLIEAEAGLTIWATVDLENFKAEFEKPEFSEASFACDFAGCNLKGELKVENSTDKGYAGGLHLKLPGGLIEADVTGGYFDHKENDVRTPWGWFIIKVGSKAAGLPIPPVQINGISGGFFFNCAVPMNQMQNVVSGSTKPTFKKDCYGGMFGLTISTIGDESLMKAEMNLQAFIEKRDGKYRLATMLMRGEMNGLSFGGGKGLITGKCTILYQNDPSQEKIEDRKFFDLNITVDATVDATDLAKQFCQYFGVEVPDVAPLTGSAQEMDNGSSPNGMKTEGKENEGDDKSSKDNNEKSFSASAGATVNVNFRVTMKPDGYNGDFSTKWHLYLGNPWEQRCEVVFIDFKTHKNPKKEFISAWAKLTASAYLCIGNELPHDGELPPIPETLKKFLDGPGIGNQATGASSAKANDARQSEADKIATMGTVTQGGMKGCRGGVMFGLGSEGDFGVHAGIVYAEGYYTYGLDVILKKLGEGSTCIGGREAGYHGWYATGQAYAMLQGEVGVHIKLFFIDKTVPIVSIGVGALLQGGLPNPTWIYGKVRAKCKLLGGLISFNQAVEFKAGDVCIPNYGNPLDNIELFASSDPGVESYKEGWLGEDKVSMFSKPMFTTNYRIGENEVINLVDENAVAQAEVKKGMSKEEAEAIFLRQYRFLIDEVKLIRYTKPNNASTSTKESSFTFNESTYHSTEGSANHQDFKLKAVNLKPNSCYKLVLTGKAQEKRNGYWGAPWYNDEKTNWKDKQDYERAKNTKNFYFQTGEASKNFDDYVALSYPHMNDNVYTEKQAVRTYDQTHPIISFKNSEYLPVDLENYDYFWNLKLGDDYIDRYVPNKALSEKVSVPKVTYNKYWIPQISYVSMDRYLTWEPNRQLYLPSDAAMWKTREVELVRVNKKMSAELQKRWEDAQKAKTGMEKYMRKDYNNTTSLTWNEALGKYVKTSNLSEYNEDLKKYVHHTGKSSSTGGVSQKQSTASTYSTYTYYDDNGNQKTGYISSSAQSSLDLNAEMQKFLDKESQEMVSDESQMREKNIIEKTGRVTEDYEQRVWSTKCTGVTADNDPVLLSSEYWYGTVEEVNFSTSKSHYYYTNWYTQDYDDVYKEGDYIYDPYLYMSYLGRYALLGNSRVYGSDYTKDYTPEGLTIKFQGGNERASNQMTSQWMNYNNDIVPHYWDHIPWKNLSNYTDLGWYTNNVYREEGAKTTNSPEYFKVAKVLLSDMISDAATLTVMTKQFKYWFKDLNKGATFNYCECTKKNKDIYKKIKSIWDLNAGVKITLTSGGNYYSWQPNTDYWTFEALGDGKYVAGLPVGYKYNEYSWDKIQTHIVAAIEYKFNEWWSGGLSKFKPADKIEQTKGNRYHNMTYNDKKQKYEYDEKSYYKQYNFDRMMNGSYIFDAYSWLKKVSNIKFLHYRANVYDMVNDRYFLRSTDTGRPAFIKRSTYSEPFKSLYQQ